MSKSVRTTRSVVVVCLMALTACGQGDDSQAAMSMSDSSGVQEMAGIEGMGGMQGASGAKGMSTEMQAHLSAMAAADGAGMQGMLAEHRQLVANMLVKMNGEMASMQMTGDAQWTATVDSLRQDLVRMPEMDAGQLKAAMPAHEARVRRLAQTHAAMMKSMP